MGWLKRLLTDPFGFDAKAAAEEMQRAVHSRDTDVALHRRDDALRLGVPYEDTEFWPAARAFGPLASGHETVSGPRREICPELYGSRIGQIVPVFETKEGAAFYEVLGFSVASGDDHIVSPRQFHIRYHHTEPRA